MNVKALEAVVKDIPSAVEKHSPELLTGLGIAGMIFTVVMAVKVTPKAMRKVDEIEIKEDKRLTKGEIVKETWKYYIPVVISGACSIACVIGANSINMKRNAALIAAYAISTQELSDYKRKAIDILGEKKAPLIKDEVAKERIERDPVDNTTVIMTGKGESLCYDPLSGRYFKSDIEKIRKAVNDFNRKMRDEMQLSLNEFYYEIGLDGIDIGNYLGWDIDKGYVELEFSSQLTEEGVPCLVIGHSNPPVYLY